jgi:hypothetical protein
MNEIWLLFELNENEIPNFMQKFYIISQDECWQKRENIDNHTQTLVYVIILNYEQHCKKPNGFVFGVLVFMQTIVY